MEDTEFDVALVTAAFGQAALTGWRELSIVEAAQDAGLPLARARARFPGPGAVLMRFGLMADQAALSDMQPEPVARDRLFDALMRRFDVLQQHRAGMVALLDALPKMPGLAFALSGATGRSMGWLLEAAGVSAQGVTGRLRAVGLVTVWLYALRAWKTDDSADLSGTMAALDKALDQAERYASYLGGSSAVAAMDEPDTAMIADEAPPLPSAEEFPPPPPPVEAPPSPM